MKADAREEELVSQKTSLLLLILLALGFAVIGCFLPRIPQPQSYHLFADRRAFLGIPNFGDVISNLPFAVIGAMGLIFLWQERSWRSQEHFLNRRERWPYIVVFVGLFLTAFGSSYYHRAPDNARLVWDRLPMTITLMGMVAVVIAERINLRLGLVLLPVLLLVGMGSVLQWYWSEVHGVGAGCGGGGADLGAGQTAGHIWT